VDSKELARRNEDVGHEDADDKRRADERHREATLGTEDRVAGALWIDALEELAEAENPKLPGTRSIIPGS
jgi:hypothetical protein